METRMRNVWVKPFKFLLKLCLTTVALILVVKKTDTDQLIALTRVIIWPWLLPAVVFFILSKVCTSLRLNIYFRDIGVRISEWKNWKLYLVGMFYNLFLPGGIGGDGYKVFLLKKHAGVPVKELLKVILLDRLNGLSAIFFLLFLLPVLSREAILRVEDYDILTPAIVGLILVIPAFWLFLKLFFTPHLQSFRTTYTWSLAGQLAQLGCCWFILLGIGVPTDQIMSYQFAFLLSSIVTVLPLTVGGVGLRELTFVYAHNYLGIEVNTAVAFSILFFLISAGVSLTGAVVKVGPLQPDKAQI